MRRLQVRPLGVVPRPLLWLSCAICAGCSFPRESVSLDAMLLMDGVLVHAELKGKEVVEGPVGRLVDSSDYSLNQIEPIESGSSRRLPPTLRMVHADRNHAKGPACDAIDAIRAAYPEGDPVQAMPVLISIEPIKRAVIARACMGGYAEQFGEADASVVIGMVSAATRSSRRGMGFTFASRNVLECEASLLISVGENGEARAEPIHATVGELLQQGARLPAF